MITETALFIAVLILSLMVAFLVVLQARSMGMTNRDAGVMQRTRRGSERTMFNATIWLSAIFLVFTLIASLPLSGSSTTTTTTTNSVPAGAP